MPTPDPVVSAVPPAHPTSSHERLQRWLLMLGALILLGAGIGLRGPTPSDEPRFALVAHQMVESGNWLIPHRGADWYADKPPTFMAMQAFSYVVTGHWWIAFLLPSLLGSLGTLWLIYDLGRRLWGHRVGMYAALGLLCTVQFVFQAKRGQIDPTVTFFITLANYGLLRHFLAGPDWRAFWLGCFAAGLGVITKGIGFLAFLMFVPWVYAYRHQWLHATAARGSLAHWLGGFVAFIAAVALWIVPLLLYVHAHDNAITRAYLKDIFLNQTVHRYVDPWNSFNPPWFYLEVIFTSWLPLSLALPAIAPTWWRRLRERDARFLLPLVWAVLVIVFFSLTRAKRDVYIMPALPLLALCMAPLLEDALQRRWVQWAVAGFMAVLAVTLLGAGVDALLFKPAFAVRLIASHQLGEDALSLWFMLIVAGALSLLCVAVFRLRRAGLAALCGLCAIWLSWGLWGAPLLAKDGSPAAVVQRVESVVGPQAALAVVAWKEEIPLAFSGSRRVKDFGFERPWHQQLSRAIVWQRGDPAHRWVLIMADVMAPCVSRADALDMGTTSGRDWQLFRFDAVVSACRSGTVPRGAVEDWGGRDNLH